MIMRTLKKKRSELKVHEFWRGQRGAFACHASKILHQQQNSRLVMIFDCIVNEFWKRIKFALPRVQCASHTDAVAEKNRGQSMTFQHENERILCRRRENFTPNTFFSDIFYYFGIKIIFILCAEMTLGALKLQFLNAYAKNFCGLRIF